MLGLVGCGDAAGLDALALLLAVVSPLQPLAEFLGAVTFQRQPDQRSQLRCARRFRLGDPGPEHRCQRRVNATLAVQFADSG